MRTLLIALFVVSTPALADESCRVEVGPHDVLKKTGDLVIDAGQVVEDAFALDGNLTLKKGAKVKNAIAFHGDVVVEAGAIVDTALSVGGSVKLGGHAGKAVEVSDRGLRVKEAGEDDVALNIVVNGKSLGRRIADEALAKVKGCQVVAKGQ